MNILAVSLTPTSFIRDVSGVETAMSVLHGTKAEIDARDDKFETCTNLGKQLINDGHYAKDDIQEKLKALTEKRNQVVDRWQDKWDLLTLCKCLVML